jgi:hypothetical protein
MNQKAGMARPELAAGYTKYQTFLLPACPVEEALPAMVSLPSFHFPPKDVTRDLEQRKAKTRQTGMGDENRMIVTRVTTCGDWLPFPTRGAGHFRKPRRLNAIWPTST